MRCDLDLSVVLVSSDGDDTLSRTLAAMTKLRRPATSVEFILVNNASIDSTREIMIRYAPQLGAQVLDEPRKGKAFALNAGIAKASGKLLIFCDDDILPSPGWFEEYIDAAVRHPVVTMFAGEVRPVWERPVPRWLEEISQNGEICGATPIGRGEEDIPPTQVKGCNMMLRRDDLGDLRFDEGRLNFGTGPLAGGEDTGLASLVAQKGGRIRFVPRACVSHIIAPEEMSLRYLFRREARIGASVIVRDALLEKPLPPLRSSRLAWLGLSCCFYFATGKQKDAAMSFLRFARIFGERRAQIEILRERNTLASRAS